MHVFLGWYFYVVDKSVDMFEDLKYGWAIKVPLGNDELYVTENERPVLYNTKEEALAAAKIQSDIF